MSSPLSWCQALEEEFERLYGRPPLPGDAPADADERLRLLHQAMHAQGPTALCLSGGGLRSATFALGVLQGLAHRQILASFDYLSTVSGGGYIGGWLSAWLHRQGPERRSATFRELDPASAVDETGHPEAPPVSHVRRTCRYLAPKGGGMSPDMWAMLATIGRNMVLNWLVLLPLVAATLLVPRAFYALSHAFESGVFAYTGAQCLTESPPSMAFLVVSLAGLGWAVGYLASVFSGRGGQWSEGHFLAWFLMPLLIGAISLTLFWSSFPCNLDLWLALGCGAVLPAAAWALLGPTGRGRRGAQARPGAVSARVGLRSIFAAGASGPILGAGAYWFATYPFGFGEGAPLRDLYAVLGVPTLLILILCSITLFVGLASRDLDDAALEWWSRCSGWIGIVATAWLAAGVVVFYLADGFEFVAVWAERSLNFARWGTTLTVSSLLPLLASLVGMAARPTAGTSRPSSVRAALQKLVVPLLVLLVLSMVAWIDLRGVLALEYHRSDTGQPCAPGQVDTGHCHPEGGGLGEAVMLGGGFLAFGLFMSAFVPVNRFSLHGMYRERLVRTFLGASREDRHPNPFTGFDARDDLRVHDLADVRPLHVINATLDAVSSTDVGQHERRAASFTFSALHAGNRELGYRPAAEYGSDASGNGTGLSLGLALAVSGAAVNPEMGMHTTKASAFLLTLANARLGLWFGNPRSATRWRNSDPPSGVAPILRELLDRTTDTNPYVLLSDGGHYDNLGLWEMVARRCRFIVVSDASCDPDYQFDDLSNAVRRIRLDLGIPIQFGPLCMTRAGQGHGNEHGAIGTIRYSIVDGPGAPDGTILYLKATLSGDETVDIRNFAEHDEAFPHDSTANQFFDPAQFESYRALGFHTVLKAVPQTSGPGGVADAVEAARAVLTSEASRHEPGGGSLTPRDSWTTEPADS